MVSLRASKLSVALVNMKILHSSLVFALLVTSTAALAQQPASAPQQTQAPAASALPSVETKTPDRADAYYHFQLGHMYEEMVAVTGRAEYATKAVDEYKAALAAVDHNDMIIFPAAGGKAKGVAYIFTDVDCPYCRKLEEQLPKVNDVTFHVFLFPLTSLHPHAYEHALGIWCSTDRPKAWADKMLKGVDPRPAKCDNPLDRNVAFGDKLHIDGTPTLILANGRPHSGTVTAQELEQLLATVPAH